MFIIYHFMYASEMHHLGLMAFLIPRESDSGETLHPPMINQWFMSIPEKHLCTCQSHLRTFLNES